MVTRMEKAVLASTQFRSPYAPKFHVLGAKFGYSKRRASPEVNDGIYAMGKGFDQTQATLRLYGEAAERISLEIMRSEKQWPLAYEVETLLVKDIFGDRRISSHGCAAHNQIGKAAFSALCELWERKLVDGWWRGAFPLRRISEKQTDDWDLRSYVRFARENAVEVRRTQFFIIDEPSPLRVCAALSSDVNGAQMAIGFAAETDLLTCLKRALEELLSVELETADLYRAKLDNDEIKPNENRAVVAARQRALAEVFSDINTFDGWENAYKYEPIAGAKDLIKKSEEFGAPVKIADITVPEVGIPVCRAVFNGKGANDFLSDQTRVQPV